MDLERYKGVFAAAPTPFFADGTVDVETAGEMVDFYVEGGFPVYLRFPVQENILRCRRRRENVWLKP